MATMNDIDKLAKELSDVREELRERVCELEIETEKIRRQHMYGIKAAIRSAADRQAKLKSAIEDSRDLFNRPKTVVLHGIKVGYQKGKGKLDWEDDAIVVRLIKRHFPDQADVLINTIEKPRKDGLNGLTVQELKKIGVTAEETGEQVVVRSVDTYVDKIVKALLKDQEEISEAA